jgi:hypothetical protein
MRAKKSRLRYKHFQRLRAASLVHHHDLRVPAERKRSGTIYRDVEHAAHDREVFHEVDELTVGGGRIGRPELMKDE